MDVSFDLINGFCIGLEYIGKDLSNDIDESVIIAELACFRWIIWLGDAE